MKKTEFGNVVENGWVNITLSDCIAEARRIMPDRTPDIWTLMAAEYHLRGLSYKRIAKCFEEMRGAK